MGAHRARPAAPPAARPGTPVARPVHPRATDFGRRTLVRAGLLAAAGGALYAGLEGAVRLADLPGARRRFTGSHPGRRRGGAGHQLAGRRRFRTCGGATGDWTVVDAGGTRKPGVRRTGRVGHDDGAGDVGLHVGLVRRPQMWTGVPVARLLTRRRPGPPERPRPLDDRLRPLPAALRPRPTCCWRSRPGGAPADAGARVPGAAGGARPPGVLVGQVGGGGRAVAAALVGPATVPADLRQGCSAAAQVGAVRDTAGVPTIDDPRELRHRVTAAPVARLATIRSDGSPRLVPVTFSVLGELPASPSTRSSPSATPGSPASTTSPAIRASCCWSTTTTPTGRRCGGCGSTATPRCTRPASCGSARWTLLAAKYPPYRTARPAGPVVVITPPAVERVVGPVRGTGRR